MRILLTAFVPFGGDSLNSAQEAVKLVPGRVDDADILKLFVPVVFGKSVDAVVSAIEREKPDAVLCIGQAGGRAAMTPERVAINIDDARIPDNEGNQPVDSPIATDGPDAYFSRLPIKTMVQRMSDAGIPASISNTAGTFVCNHLMYGVINHYPDLMCGFMHVPYMDGQGSPSLAVDVIAAGIVESIMAILEVL